MAEAKSTAAAGREGPGREFLLYLAKGGELLRADRVAEARRELEKAVALQPGEPRARSLLGFACFRLGELPEAMRIYRELVQQSPRDPSLRMNLGLVCLKSGDLESAITQLGVVLELEPRNTKALGYLGLAYARRNEYALARDAFKGAGQEDLARQMEALLKKQNEQASPFSRGLTRAGAKADEDFDLTVVDAGSTSSGTHRQAVSSATLAQNAPPMTLPKSSGEPGKTAAPLAQFAADCLVVEDSGEPFEVREDGVLYARIQSESAQFVRGPQVVAMTGALEFSPSRRRMRGRDAEEPLGGAVEPMFLVRGTGALVVGGGATQAPPAAGRDEKLFPLQLRQQALYVREDAVLAFEDRLRFENGRIPGQGGPASMLQLRGEGRVVLRLLRRPAALRVLAERAIYADVRRLLGWMGRVVPRLVAPGEDDAGGLVELSGDGVAFVGDLVERAVPPAPEAELAPDALPEGESGMDEAAVPPEIDPEVAQFSADLAAETAAPVGTGRDKEADFGGLVE
jgi:hypothetical protein